MAKRNQNLVDYDALREKFAEVKEKVEDMEASFEARVSEKPMQSVLMAAGIGVAAGMLAAMVMRRK